MTREEIVYVDEVRQDDLTLHYLIDRHIGKNFWTYTLCGMKVQFTSENVMFPLKHARRIADACEACKEAHRVQAQDDSAD